MKRDIQQCHEKQLEDGPVAWLVCLSAGLFFFYEFFQLNSFDVLNPIFRETFHLQALELSLLSSAFLWANLLFLLPAGILLDHVSVKKTMLVTLAICVLGVVCLTLGKGHVAFFIGRFLAGVGNAFCFLSCIILVSRWFSQARQGFVMGLMVTMAFVGGMLAHAPLVVLIETTNWSTALWLDVVMGGVIWLLIAFFVQDSPAPLQRSQTPELRKIAQTFLTVLKVPQTYLAGLYTCLLNLPIMILCALWGASYLQVVYGASTMQATQIISLLLFGSMIGSPCLGWLSDRQGRRKPMMWLGVLGSLLCLLPLWWIDSLSLGTLALVFMGLGFFTSAQVMSYPLLAEIHLPQHVGNATGVASMIIMGGAAVGQLLFGAFVQNHAGAQTLVYSVSDYQYAMSIFPVAIGLAGIILWFIKEVQHGV